MIIAINHPSDEGLIVSKLRNKLVEMNERI